MIKLYGFELSNYFSMVKACLLEKGIDFEVVPARPSQDADYRAKSPMGKVPCIETEHGFLAETSVILEYLEQIRPTPALLPADPYARAKVRELMHSLELYIELPARTCYAPVFFDGAVSDAVRAQARNQLERGAGALRKLARFSPHIAGSALTLADLMAMYTLPIAGRVTRKLWDWDLYADLPGASEWQKQMSERESVRRIRAEQRTAAAQ